MLDLVIAGGHVVDGLGGPARRADVGLEGGRVSVVGDLSAAETTRTLDATGLHVLPGMVDAHSHSELTVLSDGRARSKVRQGVTTEINGNCGLGPFPTGAGGEAQLRAAVALLDYDPGVPWPAPDLHAYRHALDDARPAINVAVLAGHIPLRLAAAPDQPGPLDRQQILRLAALADESIEAGAVGLSTGLMYPPAMSAERDELLALGAAVAKRGAVFSVHARNYSFALLDAIDEAIDIALTTGCRLQFSHLAVAGRANWGSVARALERIDAANERGADIAADIYPYLAGSANLSQLLPEWAQLGGAPAIVERLRTASDRARVLAEWPGLLQFGWDEVEVSAVDDEFADVLGMNIVDAAATRDADPSEFALDLIAGTENRVMMVAYGRSEDDLWAALDHPATMIGSDGLALDPDGPTGMGRPHPRSYGCYPRWLGPFVRTGRISLERAVRMATALPAERFGLRDRGTVVPGSFADLTIVDLAKLEDLATYHDPARFPVGVEHVLVAGELVVEDGRQHDDVRPGVFVTR